MDPIWPSRSTFLSRPHRVSRLFVVLFVFSATLNAGLILFNGYSQMASERVETANDHAISSILIQSAKYKGERDLAQASVEEKEAQLVEVNAELKQKTERLVEIERQLASVNEKVKTQEVQLASNSAELEALRTRPPLFNFIRQTDREVSQDEAEVKEIVTAAYDEIQRVYSSPYILHQITISFVDSYSIEGASGEITITNSPSGIEITIKMKSFDKDSYENVNTIVHEIIHGFHGIAALSSPILEEGIAVAATEVVMDKLYERGVISFDYGIINLSDAQASELNSTLTSPPSDSTLYDLDDVYRYYQLAGWSWLQLYEANENFFINFNQKLYTGMINGQKPTVSTVSELIKETVTAIDGQPISNYLSSQISFNPV